ncbi:MAG: phosphotransferase [Bacteriovoracaceae bacterium]
MLETNTDMPTTPVPVVPANPLENRVLYTAKPKKESTLALSDLAKFRQPAMKENSEEARVARVKFLGSLGKELPQIANAHLKATQVKSNIESFVGTSTIPAGLVGPLLYEYEKGKLEPVFTLATTTEGALIASMNRGASIINACGGFRAHVQDKVMLRAPLFCFENLWEAKEFMAWLKEQQTALAIYIKQYSQRAELIEIKTNLYGRNVDTKFYYRTADAAGQNITTICTWHACLWIEKEFNQNHAFSIKNFVLEGNGGSDKKFTYNALVNGRGVNVVAETIIDREVLVSRLKVTPEEVLHFFNISHQITTGDGMVGNNINVANAIAAIFAATGQDLACIHESAVGLLQIEPHLRGLYFSLKLPKLVIGTVGGGTGLPTQKEALEVMGCYGAGKVQRLAEMIAGFSLGLEISTITAMISGQFALAHERLGRNKPVNFIQLDEIKAGYLEQKLSHLKLNYLDNFDDKNGIITQITIGQSSKHLGLSLWQVEKNDQKSLAILKSKPTYQETLNCMYILTGLIDPKLAKSFCLYQERSEFVGNHTRETAIYDYLHLRGYPFIPNYFGTVADHEREGHMILMEYLDENNFRLINSENTPENWSNFDFSLAMEKAIEASALLESMKATPFINYYQFKDYGPFFAHAIEILGLEYGVAYGPIIKIMKTAFNYLEKNESTIHSEVPLVVVHNDFNPRNVAITKADQVKIYDWELATIDAPHRDFMELYCFTKNKNLDVSILKEQFEAHLALHFRMERHPEAYKYAFSKFLVTRVTLYLLGNKLNNYKFMKSLLMNMAQINAEEKYYV